MRNDKIIPTLKILTLFLIALTMVGSPLASQPQLEIDSVIGLTRNAIQIKYAGNSGFVINSASGAGVVVGSANVGVSVGSVGLHGFFLGSSGSTGVRVDYAGGDGVRVFNAGGDGVCVNSADQHSMNIQGEKSGSTLAGHIGLVYNRNTTTNADVLALKVGTSGNPVAGNNFITFYNGSDASLGAVEGNGSGGISYTSSGSDYAEYLPLLDHAETFGPGDIIGVYGGHISKQTANAQRVMVITDQAAMIGNKPVSTQDDDVIEGYETVSFIGQVRTKVRGKVQAGDWIVACGYNDGTGVAIAASDIGLNHQIVGRAWESSSDPEVKRINIAVGLDQSQSLIRVINTMEKRIQELEKQQLTNVELNK